MSTSDDELYSGVDIGEPVFDEDGEKLGTIRGLDSSGFYVRGEKETARKPLTSVRDVTGVAYVMWRCWECGEMGQLEDMLPDNCPNCNAPREELYYWAED